MTVHLARDRRHARPLPACNATSIAARLTADPAEVTCRMCMRTRLYRSAVGPQPTITLADMAAAKPGDFIAARIKSALATHVAPTLHIAEVIDRDGQRTLTVRPVCGTPRRGTARKPNGTSTPCARCQRIAPTRGIDLTGSTPT